MNDIQKIVGVLGHNLDPIIKLLRPKDLAYFASTDKENLSHVQDYLKRVKEKWKEREQYCLEYNWEKRTYIEKGVNPQFERAFTYKKFIMIFDDIKSSPRVNLPIAVDIVRISSGCSCSDIKIYGIAIGGKGCTKMQDGTIPKKTRNNHPLILRPYPIYKELWLEYFNPRFIPYQI